MDSKYRVQVDRLTPIHRLKCQEMMDSEPSLGKSRDVVDQREVPYPTVNSFIDYVVLE